MADFNSHCGAVHLNRNITTGLDRLNASLKIALNGTISLEMWIVFAKSEIGAFESGQLLGIARRLLDTSKMFSSLLGGVGST